MSIDYTTFSNEEVEPVYQESTIIEEEIQDDAPTMMGEIYNTQKVYLRKEADKDSSPVTVLDKGDEVMIDGVKEDSVGNGWYHLITASGNEGYTMSEFVKIIE